MGKNIRRFVNAAVLLTVVVVVFFLQRHSSDETPLYTSGLSFENSSSQTNHLLVAKEKAELLDKKYIPRLITQHGRPSTAHQALKAEEQFASSKYTTAIVIGRMKDEPERVQWVYDKLMHINDAVIYIVDDSNTDGPHLKTNHGREAAVYLSYIIDNYEKLNDITFFWHTDEVVWHNNLLMRWNSVETINRMDRENIIEQGYVPSRCDHWPGCPEWIKFNPSKPEHNIDPHRLVDMFQPELFSRLFPEVEEFPPYFAGTCCSQFAVSRDAIRSRPIETYQHLLHWILEYQYDDRSGMVFEYTWPYIFLERGSLCPAMSECYCKTYNFCMEDAEDVQQLESWNGLRTRREEVKWQVTFMEEALTAKQAEYLDSGAPPEDILALEDRFQPEIDRLDAELERLINVTWQKREQIVRHWKLPVPPVGW